MNLKSIWDMAKGFVLPYVKDRIKEPSTWRGLALLATAIGIPISPDQATAIMSFGLSIAGAIGVLTPDKISKTVTK